MDEGTAALIAGIAGMVGALGGAVAGGIAAVRGARIGAEMTAEAARQQVQDQASADHEHWLRQERLAAYTGLLQVYSTFGDIGMQLRRQIERSPLGTEVPREQLAELSVSAYELQKIRQRVRLLGTGEVNTCALRMEDAVFKVADDLAALSKAISNSDPAVRDFGLIHDESVGAAAEAHSDFIDAVRAVVGDRKNDPS